MAYTSSCDVPNMGRNDDYGSRTKASMAGSVNSDDVEDVLSSIRRLVSEDLRPPMRPQIVVAPVAVTAGPDKLILTPAQRVLPIRTLTVVPKVAPPEPKPMPRLHLGVEHGVTRTTPDVVATLGQGVDQGKRLDWESEGGEPDMDGLDWSSFTFARRSTKETFAAQVIAAEIAAPLAAHAERAEQSWAQATEVKTAKTEAPEAPMAVDVSSDEQDWADLAEAEVLADLAEPEATAEPGPEDIDGSQQEEDNIFSEQVLRELVRDLIREQLQGDLGERITRNIRKMVRAEISNALAVHKLD